MPPSYAPYVTQRVLALATELQTAPRGSSGALVRACADELALSVPTVYRIMDQVTLKKQRKQRSDAGEVSLSKDEAIAISSYLMSSLRKGNKRLRSIGQAVVELRADGIVRAQRIDPATGEVSALSESAVSRALKTYRLHPDQLLRPAPAKEMQSLHPNHVWQIDASLCVLYYLKASGPKDSGVQVMDADKFYKNKPANLKAIEADRVWRYAVTDHYSGAIFVHYVMGAESGANLAESFIAAIQQRQGASGSGQPFHGVPYILMMDMGSANTSGLFKQLARRLQVEIIAHAPGTARATGQVEVAHNIIERSFESGLRLSPVQDLAGLNALAGRWQQWFNSTQIHSRHGKTRFDMWMTIRAEQLRIAPAPELCRQLVNHKPEKRKVGVMLTVNFGGAEYDVSGIPGIVVGESVMMAINPYAADAATVVEVGADGKEALHSVPLVARNDAGFRADANVIGEGYTRHADTLADTHRKLVERTIMDAPTDEAAEAARKAKALPFGGRIDPFKKIDDAPERTFLPRKGEALAVQATTAATPVPARLLTHFEAGQWLTGNGVAMDREVYDKLRAWHPEGVPEDQLAALKDRLTVRSGLRVVAGGSKS
jgi:transposase InsO family protein